MAVDNTAFELLQQWVQNAEVSCELLEPGSERQAVLAGLQVSTRSLLGTMAYHTGGLLIEGGWIRLLGCGHPCLPRTLTGWNTPRQDGYYLVGDDAAGGFFALNGGGLGSEVNTIYYWPPDSLEWECLQLKYSEFVAALLTSQAEAFYEGLRWQTWRADICALTTDHCFAFYPFLWAVEGSLERSHRSIVPIREAFDIKVRFSRQLTDTLQ